MPCRQMFLSPLDSTVCKAVSALATVTFALALASLPATTAHAVGHEAGGPRLDEIFVVAQKKNRAEDLQEVPAAISAYTGDQLDARFFQSIDDLGYSIPNVQLEEVGTFPGVQNFSIRGQGINSSIPSVDPTVGTFVDGVYIGTTFGVVLDTWDLESVEVLRGPQGLLFGRNVTGGAVLLRTARPDPAGEFATKARAQITDSDRYNISFAVEGPLVDDVLAGKFMYYYDDDDGYFDNNNTLAGAFPSPPFVYFNQGMGPPGTPQRNLGKMETKIARPSFVWTPSDVLELSLVLETGDVEGDGAPWTVVSDGGLDVPDQASGELPKFATTMDDYGITDIEWDSATLEVNWDVWGGTITNITGWRELEAFATADVDGQGLPIFTAPGNTKQDQISNELRFAKTIADVWDTTIGLYYFDQDIEYRESRYIQVDLTMLPAVVPSPAFATIALGGDMNTETYGVFWNNDITFADDWTLTAGIRWSDEEKQARIISGPKGGGAGSCTDVVAFSCKFDRLRGEFDSWTPKLGISHRYDENSQWYAFWTKGFRTGGFNFRNARPMVLPAGPTRQEEQNSWELGLKKDVFDNRLRMNFAYFRNEIDDIQRELNVGDPAVIVLQGTINAGDVTIQGVEFEFQAVPTENTSLFGTLGYLDGDYDRVNPAFASFLGPDLPRLAPWSFSLGGSVDVFLDGNGSLTFQADIGYRDGHPYDDANLQRFEDQHRLNASVTWNSPDEAWSVALFGKNLQDEANYGNLTSIAGLYTAGPMQRGKEVGLEVQWRN